MVILGAMRIIGEHQDRGRKPPTKGASSMGDRANVVVPDPYNKGQATYLYTHWQGHELPDTLGAALDRGRGRWTDYAYLTRIIFNQMTKGREMDETGFGISTTLCDNEYPLLVVDTEAQVVRVVAAKWDTKAANLDLFDGPEVPFAEATAETLRLARDGVRV